MDGFPQHYAAASLKPFRQARYRVGSRMFSAALRCGLIEAAHAGQGLPPGAGFPQHYAAASLKRALSQAPTWSRGWFSAALRCGCKCRSRSAAICRE